MAIRFIPNQPITFEADVQSCKNRDNKDYAMLLQAGDNLHLQMQHDPCSDELLSTPGFYSGSEILTNTGFQFSSTGWTVGSWVWSPGNMAILSSGAAPLSQTQTLQAGQPYKLTISVSGYITGTLACFIGETLAGKISADGVYEFIVTPSVDSECRFQNDPDNVGGYQPLNLSVDYISLTDMAMGINWGSGNLTQSRSYCVNPDFAGNANGWTLDSQWAYSSNHIVKTPGTAQAAYQEVDDIVSRNGYEVEVTVGGRTAGTLTVIFGNVMIGTISANGTYTYKYPLPTIFEGTYPANALVFEADTAFDGYVSHGDIVNTYSLVKYTSDGICKVDNTQASTIEWGTLDTYSHLSRLALSIRGYQDGTVALTVDGVTSDTVSGNGDFTIYCLDAVSPITPAASIEINLSADFLGCLTVWSFKEFNIEHTITVVSGITEVTDDYNASSSQNPLVYHQNYISWYVDFDNVLVGGVADSLAPDCYILRVYDGCTATTYDSDTLINYSSNAMSCTVLTEAYCDTPAFGFDFSEGFKLVQRLRLLRISPKYPIKGDGYTYSTGRNVTTYTDVDKIWQAWFDYVNEVTHDCIAVQLSCDHYFIQSVEYFAPAQDYEPEWATNMKRNLAQSRVDLKKKTSKLYNRNIQ